MVQNRHSINLASCQCGSLAEIRFRTSNVTPECSYCILVYTLTGFSNLTGAIVQCCIPPVLTCALPATRTAMDLRSPRLLSHHNPITSFKVCPASYYLEQQKLRRFDSSGSKHTIPPRLINGASSDRGPSIGWAGPMLTGDCCGCAIAGVPPPSTNSKGLV